MPNYDYQCPECKKVVEAKRVIAHRDVVPQCMECKVYMKRIITQMPSINWGGLKPSDLENNRSSEVQGMIDNESENRDKFIQKNERRKKK